MLKWLINSLLLVVFFFVLPYFSLLTNPAYSANLNIESGAKITVEGELRVEGDINFNAGEITQTTGTISLTGSWNKQTGIFTSSAGMVEFRGISPSYIYGDNTFYNLILHSLDGPKSIYFESAKIQTVTNNLVLTGYDNKTLTIRSTINGSQASLSIPASIITGVDYIDVKDNIIGEIQIITAGEESFDTGNNTNWVFLASSIQGSIIINTQAEHTSSCNVDLALSTQGQIPQQMKFSNDKLIWSTPEDYFSRKNWILSQGDGEKTVYAKFKDSQGKWSISFSDSIILDTTPPQITSLIPATGTTFYENDIITISATANDSDSSPLEYRFFIDGEIKQAWSRVATYNYIAGFGTHNIKVEAQDVGGIDNKESEIHVFRKPINPPN